MTMGIPGGDVRTARSTASSTICGCASSRRCRRLSARTRSTAAARQAMPAPSATSRCARPRATWPPNLSLHGYGMAYYAARDLQEQINFMIDLLERQRDHARVRRARHVAGDRPGRHARARRRHRQLALPDAGDLRRHHHRAGSPTTSSSINSATASRVIDIDAGDVVDPAVGRRTRRRPGTRPTTTWSMPASCGWPTRRLGRARSTRWRSRAKRRR